MVNDLQKLGETRQYWDSQAAVFDNEPDHGLHDPIVRDAWANLLTAWLPAPPAHLLDIGCGTGSLSVLLAAHGYTVTGIDLSPAMLAQAEEKARLAGQSIIFKVMDGAAPQLAPASFDVILCRHLLWALAAPDQVLQRWAQLLRPGGRFVLIEGYWHTGGGLHVQDVLQLLPAFMNNIRLQHLSHQAVLWGGPVTDERYAVLADCPQHGLR